MEVEHVYTSRLGKKFLSWVDWVARNETPGVFKAFQESINTGEIDERTEELFKDWVADQQIVSHKVFDKDGNLISYDEF